MGKAASTTDWDALARMPTLVVLMGLTQIDQTVVTATAGRDPATPAAAISAGTTSAQRSIHAPFAELPAAIAATGLSSPAVTAIGAVADLGETLAWFMPDGSGRIRRICRAKYRATRSGPRTDSPHHPTALPDRSTRSF